MVKNTRFIILLASLDPIGQKYETGKAGGSSAFQILNLKHIPKTLPIQCEDLGFLILYTQPISANIHHFWIYTRDGNVTRKNKQEKKEQRGRGVT